MTGSIKNNLPKTCNNSFFGGETSLYKIEKGFKSSGNSIILDSATNSINQTQLIKMVFSKKCDESWSMDNIKIRIMKYK